jgi:hypothetical protein
MTYLAEARKLDNIRDVVRAIIQGTVDFLSTPGNPRGCLSVQGALTSATGSEFAQKLMCDLRRRGTASLKKRIQEAQAAGQLSNDVDPTDFSQYISIVVGGMSIQAVNGATHSELQRMGDLTLKQLGYA